MSIHQINIYGKDKVEVAIDRFKTFEPPEGYYLAFSGGKDSVVIKALADMSGVKYDAHYHVTSVDPPELIHFIKEYHPDVAFDGPKDKDGNRVTMWNLIPKKKMPPTRLVRYCCQALKEGGGDGRFTVTGVRWAESAKRKNNRAGVEIEVGSSKRELVDPDNPDYSEMARFCPSKGNHILNPIIDWSNAEIWEFIKEYNIPYCDLYDKGFKRIGCIGCPMATNQLLELERYPKFKKAYLSAFERMLKVREKEGKETNWKTADDVMSWWGGNGQK
jgi:phosphoadenosine phosphosulfate reductase